MFNSYKQSEEPRRLNRADGSTPNDGTNVNDMNNFIRSELLKICKLRIQICRLTNDGQLVSLSEYIDTNLIQES